MPNFFFCDRSIDSRNYYRTENIKINSHVRRLQIGHHAENN